MNTQVEGYFNAGLLSPKLQPRTFQVSTINSSLWLFRDFFVQKVETNLNFRYLLMSKKSKKNQGVKGQIISKRLFGVLEFSQKRTNKFVLVVKTNSFVCLLGEFEDVKSPFEII